MPSPNAVEAGKRRLVAVVGPTAVGKTELSIELAKVMVERLSMQIRVRFTEGWILEPQNRLFNKGR